MKNAISLLALFIMSYSFVFADNAPDPIPLKLVELKSKAWYEQMVKSWSKYLTEHSATKKDLLEYFKASVYAGESREELELITQQIASQFPDSFEARYASAKLKGWTDSGLEELQLCLSEVSTSPELLPDLIMISELKMNRISRSKFSRELFESKLVYPSLLNYSYNVLMSVGEDGVLYVKGEQTTIPLWILQDALNVRKDVKVLNLDMAKNELYLNRWLENTGLQRLDNSIPMDSHSLITKLPELNPSVSFYYGLTIPGEQIEPVKDQLYVVGLTSMLSNEPIDQYQALQQNIENRFLIDYLTVDFGGEPKSATGRVYETNYILPLLLLKEYYDKAGNMEPSRKMEEIIIKVAERSQVKNRVKLLMNNRSADNKEAAFAKAELDVKSLDKHMVKVKGNLYASIHELTNQEYWDYLDYLFQNGYDELYEKSIVDLSKYDDFTATLLNNYHYSPVNAEVSRNRKGKGNEFFNYPAIDMTYEAANAYCEWLTYQYNLQEGRKFKKVKFKLPSQQEWTMAALGHPEFTSWKLEENEVNAYSNWKKQKKDLKTYELSQYEVRYPWWYPVFSFRDKIRNQMGCYLANVKTPDEIFCPSGIKGDGWTLMAPVQSYFPNRMGLSDVCGNVAEMIDQEGKAMGGSWNHEPEESTITSINEYENSDSSVGFRLFMEVIDE